MVGQQVEERSILSRCASMESRAPHLEVQDPIKEHIWAVSPRPSSSQQLCCYPHSSTSNSATLFGTGTSALLTFSQATSQPTVPVLSINVVHMYSMSTAQHYSPPHLSSFGSRHKGSREINVQGIQGFTRAIQKHTSCPPKSLSCSAWF